MVFVVEALNADKYVCYVLLPLQNEHARVFGVNNALSFVSFIFPFFRLGSQTLCFIIAVEEGYEMDNVSSNSFVNRKMSSLAFRKPLSVAEAM